MGLHAKRAVRPINTTRLCGCAAGPCRPTVVRLEQAVNVVQK